MVLSIRRSMAAKIITLALGAAAIMALTYLWVIPRVSDSIYDEKRLKTRHLVETAAGIINYYVGLSQSGDMPLYQAQQRAKDVLESLRYEQDDYFFILDYDAKTQMHPFSKELVGKDTSSITDAAGRAVFADMAKVGQSQGQGFVDYMWRKPGHQSPSPKISYVKAIPKWRWIVGTGIYVDDVAEQIQSLLLVIIGFVIVIFIATVIASVMVARSMTKPLRKTVELITDIAQGQGDLTARIKVSAKDEIASLANGFNMFVEKLNDIIVQVLKSADIVQHSTMEISHGNQDLSERVQQQASAIEETASAMEEMTSAVRQEATHAREANRMAQQTAQVAQKGGEVVQSTIEAMGAVSESSKKINEIITVVNEIAFQTNLLALNAAVEAARAGEAGRGFAVVAGEVRNLAGRSAKAAKEIQTLITDSVEKVAQGNRLVGDSGSLLSEIIKNVQSVADISKEIDSSVQEQAIGIEQVSKAINQMDEVVQQNAALVEEAAAASEEMATAAASLRHQMSGFKVDKNTRPQASPQASVDSPANSKKPLPKKSITRKNKDADDFFEKVDLDGFEEF